MTTSVPYGNYNEFGMHSDAERYFWASYHIFLLLSSLVGDTLILVASFHKDAFKVNKFLATTIQHIAISNLAFSIATVLPGTISLIAGSWVFGETMCYVKVSIGYVIYPAGMGLIAVLTTGKFLLLKFPLRPWTTKKAHVACSIIWAYSLAYSGISLTIMFLSGSEDAGVYFDFRVYNCRLRLTGDFLKYAAPVISLIYLYVPNLIIIATTIPTLKYLANARKSARRVQGSVPWQGALTVALTAVIYSISSLPSAVYYSSSQFVRDHYTKPFHLHLFRIGVFMAMINITSNFYIYALTIKSFRRFLLSKVVTVAPTVASVNSTNM